MSSDFSDRFKVLKRLSNSKRKFGQVFLAEEKLNGEKVVIKFLDKTKVKESAINQLKSESQFKFESKQLQSSIELEETQTELFLVKQYVEGKPLNEITDGLSKKKKLTLLKSVFRELSPAFDELRERNIVHADIKPGNIIVNEENDKLTATLIDFGLSFRIGEGLGRKLLFPLGYAAPELLLNKLEIVDFTSDCYALGTTVWRIFEEKMPLIHPNPSITTNLQLNHPLPDLSRSLRELNGFIKKCTAKHSFDIPPNKMQRSEQLIELKKAQQLRYASYQDFLHDFNQVKIKSRIF